MGGRGGQGGGRKVALVARSHRVGTLLWVDLPTTLVFLGKIYIFPYDCLCVKVLSCMTLHLLSLGFLAAAAAARVTNFLRYM